MDEFQISLTSHQSKEKDTIKDETKKYILPDKLKKVLSATGKYTIVALVTALSLHEFNPFMHFHRE